jgi:predicted TIM-barrel fold metal-dependent hydrolase
MSGATTSDAMMSDAARAAGAGAPLIDCDVHITWQSLADLLPYVDRVWHRRLLRGAGHSGPPILIRPNFWSPLRGAHKEAAAPAAGGPPGSDPSTLARDWLDRHDIAYAVLNHYDAPVVSTLGDVDCPTAVAHGYNQWLIERWLAHDRRFLGSMIVATQDPQAAAQEIETVGQHPQIVQVLLATGTRSPYGARFFDPIYAAAERRGLQIALHTGTEGHGTSNPPGAAGWPTQYIEWHACQPQPLAAHLTSLITEGIFAKFPRLTFVFLEGGAAWVAPFLWRLDKNFKALRSECPWVTELPSEYVRRHFRFGTQGIEVPESPDEMRTLWLYLEEMDAAETLVYASNYPRWDMEAPAESAVLRTAGEETRRRIGYENARRLYGLVG